MASYPGHEYALGVKLPDVFHKVRICGFLGEDSMASVRFSEGFKEPSEMLRICRCGWYDPLELLPGESGIFEYFTWPHRSG